MKNKYKNKNVLIIGLKKSGKSALQLLLAKGAFCYVFDDDPNVLKQFAGNGNFCTVPYVNQDVIKIMDYLVISPGVSIFSEYVKLAGLFGVKVVGELELGLEFAKGKIIGVTGTNGKTTTCNLIYHILKLAKKSCNLCGNVGDPICENLLPFKSNYVVEMSSFQLESATKICPDIAVILNITPNHLDRHLTFANYKNAKFNIFKNLSKNGILVLNFDDKVLFSLKKVSKMPKIVWISQKSKIDGYFACNGKIVFKNKKNEQVIADIGGAKLVGKHNIYNMLCAVAVCKKLKIKNSVIQQGLLSFSPLKHRLQFVKNVNGIDYVNDSKSTTPDSTITAINSVDKPTILLLGGSDKNTSFNNLAKKIKKAKTIKNVVVCGETSNKIVCALKKVNYKNFKVATNFNTALCLATNLATEGDVVLLSPACASFDFFDCFEKRGDKFIEYVNKLKEVEVEK